MDKISEIVNNLKGVIAVVNTPFTEDNQIDSESIKGYVKHAVESNVSGFLVPAMAAEENKLSPEERSILMFLQQPMVVCMFPEDGPVAR